MDVFHLLNFFYIFIRYNTKNLSTLRSKSCSAPCKTFPFLTLPFDFHTSNIRVKLKYIIIIVNVKIRGFECIETRYFLTYKLRGIIDNLKKLNMIRIYNQIIQKNI